MTGLYVEVEDGGLILEVLSVLRGTVNGLELIRGVLLLVLELFLRGEEVAVES